MLCVYHVYIFYMPTLCSSTHFLSSASSFSFLYASLAYFNLLILYSIFSICSIYTSFSSPSVNRWDLYLLPAVQGVWLRDGSGSIYTVYTVDMRDISNIDAILLSAVLICDIVCLLNIVDNSTPGVYCRLGLGVLNGFLKF